MVAAVRCAPPQNLPTPEERDTCAPWIERELRLLLPGSRPWSAWAGIGWDAALRALASAGVTDPAAPPEVRPRRRGRALRARSPPLTLLGCYHPSQQNTFTGRLTEPMLDAVLGRAPARL